ncbi:SPOR domain-containing protein [Marinicella meishanensis]|uniref:SPOR domain-containing protein n=1 Tax=Marinicella meishanensis TaxID=2873263 RepID=UPI001CC09E1C|nr:SPOR domain-containing protein [Marinicella sp. NBU2979]
MRWPKTWLISAWLGCLWLPLAVAQNGEDADEEQPPPETEIVCFAAKKQWVCAPADDKDKAHQKAMKLAEQPDQVESFNDGQVEIQTMPSGQNFAQQVQEVDPNSLQAQIQDFIPRETAVNEQPAAANEAARASDQTAEPSNPLAQADAPAGEPVMADPESTVTMAQADSEPPVNRDDLMDQPAEPVTRPSNPSRQNTSNDGSAVANDFRAWQRNHPEQWAFQVVGTSNRHHIDDFVRTSGIQAMPHAVVRTEVNGADWWVVLVGLFDSREQALSQRHTLPDALAGNAWVRQIQTIVGQAD